MLYINIINCFFFNILKRFLLIFLTGKILSFRNITFFIFYLKEDICKIQSKNKICKSLILLLLLHK